MDSFGPRSGGKTMASGVFWPDDPHISLLPPTKIQMNKCAKCGREFCCYMNFRRHSRSHRLMLQWEDLRHERQNIAAFLSKLPDDAFKRILDVDYKLEDICGATAMRGLDRFVHVPSFGYYAHNYFKSGSALHDTVRKQQVSSAHELFNILDEATEKTFLSGSTSESVVRYMLEGAGGKTSLDDKMHIASVAFLVEHNLVTAWISAKSEQAKLVQEALEKEEDDAQRRQKVVSEKKRLKRLKQKEKRALLEETGAEELESTFKDGEAESGPKDGDALAAESSPKGGEKLAAESEPKSDRVSEPLAEAREATEEFQDSGGWQKQGKVKWADMVEPTHNRRNWSRNSRQDNRVNTFPGPLMNGMKPEHRQRPKQQRVTTAILTGARPAPVKLPSNVVWARKMPANSGKEDSKSPTLPPPPPATGPSAAEATSNTSQSSARAPLRMPATEETSPATGLSAPPQATVKPSLPPVTGASALESVTATVSATAISAAEASTSAPEAREPPPLPAADGSVLSESVAPGDGMNVMMVGTLEVPWSASTQGFRNGLLTPPEAAALTTPTNSQSALTSLTVRSPTDGRRNDLVTPTAIEKAEGGAADRTGSMDVRPTGPSESASKPEKAEGVGADKIGPGSSNTPQGPASSNRSTNNELANQVPTNVPQREVALSLSKRSSKTAVQKAETVAVGQSAKSGSSGTNASSRKAVPRSSKNELVTCTAADNAESGAADQSPEAASPEVPRPVEKAESVAVDSGRPASPTASDAYEEFMYKRWGAAFTDPNAVVLKLEHEADAGPDLKSGSR